MAQQTGNTSNEISLQELFAIAKQWFFFLLSKWKIWVLTGLMGGAIGFTYAFFQKKEYKAELSFALEEKSGSSMGSYAAIASQFGIDLGGGGGGAFAGDNLVELLKTRLMVEKALLNPVVINNDTELLVNRYIDIFELRERWESKPYLKDLTYKKGVPRDQFTIEQDSILDYIQENIRKNMLTVRRLNKKLNLVIATCISIDPLFSKYFIEELVSTASFYYIDGKTKRSRANITTIESKIDSVKVELDNRLYGAARAQDRDINVVSAQKRVPLAQKQIDIQLLTLVYAELTKNLEMSKYALSRDEPLVHIIDTPILPLRYEKPGKISSFIIFGFISGLITLITLLIKQKIAEGKKNE